ncbi:MAG: hypothetical protein K0Q66_1418 [Chitinophagaceae bacterium]|nr:hypothetical protein [Chitinophagaceae bacterium]
MQATFKAQIVSAKENMKQLILVFLFSAVFFGGKAASSDTAFVDYETFRRLSKREIKERFGTDDAARGIIRDHYRGKTEGWGWSIPALVGNGAGVYFSILASNATNGMGSTVGLVLAIGSFGVGLISTYLFLKRVVFRGQPSKEKLYKRLREHHSF